MSRVDLSLARWRKSARSTNGNNASCVEVALVEAAWRKSSRSNNGGNGACVQVALVDAAWRKTIRSTNGNNAACVEVAFTGPGAAVRDSKNPAGPALVVPAAAWQGLLGAAKRGTLDVL
jgi:hypothetical protein